MSFGPSQSSAVSCPGRRPAWGGDRLSPCVPQTEFLMYNPPFYTADRKDKDLVDPVGE